MATAKASLNNYRQSPRKVRLMADLVRGKKVTDAIALLTFAEKKSASPVKKLVASALANAKNIGLNESSLVVKDIQVNPGAILYRRLSMSRGRAFPMRKRTSHIDVVLSDGVTVSEVKSTTVEKDIKPAKVTKTKKATSKAVKSEEVTKK